LGKAADEHRYLLENLPSDITMNRFTWTQKSVCEVTNTTGSCPLDLPKHQHGILGFEVLVVPHAPCNIVGPALVIIWHCFAGQIWGRVWHPWARACVPNPEPTDSRLITDVF